MPLLFRQPVNSLTINSCRRELPASSIPSVSNAFSSSCDDKYTTTLGRDEAPMKRTERKFNLVILIASLIFNLNFFLSID